MEGVKNGIDTSVFLSSAVLSAAWALAVVLRNRDHWLQALSPPVLDAQGRPGRRRMWWVLWPFFNLALITSAIAVADDYRDKEGIQSVMNYVEDDKLW